MWGSLGIVRCGKLRYGGVWLRLNGKKLYNGVIMGIGLYGWDELYWLYGRLKLLFLNFVVTRLCVESIIVWYFKILLASLDILADIITVIRGILKVLV